VERIFWFDNPAGLHRQLKAAIEVEEAPVGRRLYWTDDDIAKADAFPMLRQMANNPHARPKLTAPPTNCAPPKKTRPPANCGIAPLRRGVGDLALRGQPLIPQAGWWLGGFVLDNLPARNLAGLKREGASPAPKAEPETRAWMPALPTLALGADGISPTAPLIDGRRDHSIVDTLRRLQAKSDQADALKDSTGDRGGDVLGGLRRASAWHLASATGGRRDHSIVDTLRRLQAKSDQLDARKDSTGGRRSDVLGRLRQASAWHLASASGGRRNSATHTLRRTITRDAGSQRQELTEDEVEELVKKHPNRAQEILDAHASSDEYFYASLRGRLALSKQSPLQPRSGSGGMFGRIGGKNSATPGWDHLLAAGETATIEWDIETKTGGVETYGQKSVPVKSVSQKRVAKHQRKWKVETGGDKSARAHVLRTVGEELANSFDWDITHLAGWAQAGPSADTMDHNLVAASNHANTEMMFFDGLITGNREVIIKTRAEVYTDTRVAKSIHMEFAHAAAPDQPFFTRDVSGLRPAISPDEAKELRKTAQYQITATLDTVDTLMNMPQAQNSQSSNNMTTVMADSDLEAADTLMSMPQAQNSQSGNNTTTAMADSDL